MEPGSKGGGTRSGLWPYLGLGLEWQLRLTIWSSIGERPGSGQGMGGRAHKGSNQKGNRNIKDCNRPSTSHLWVPQLDMSQNHLENTLDWQVPIGAAQVVPGADTSFERAAEAVPTLAMVHKKQNDGIRIENNLYIVKGAGQNGLMVRFLIRRDVLISKTFSEHRFRLDG